MDAELKAKWVEALRSEKYQQCTGVLRSNIGEGRAGYCCIGVLLDIQQANWTASPMHGAYDAEVGEVACNANTSAEAFVRAFPLMSREIALDLMNKNDGCGDEDHRYTFPEIADHIEKIL